MNLTCRRNPWKLASPEDASYRAFMYNPEFLKTILPISDELNRILGRIFTHDPAKRITLPQLRREIMACPRFTNHPPRMSQEPIFQGEDVANVYEQAAAQPLPKPTLVFEEDVMGEQDPVTQPHAFNFGSHQPYSPTPDDSDDSDDSDVSDTWSECSNNSSSSMDGIESDARPQVPVDTQNQDVSAGLCFRAFEDNQMMDFPPSPERYLRQPHVPSLRNNALPSPPISPRTAAASLPAQHPNGQAPNPLFFRSKLCPPHRDLPQCAPQSLPPPSAPCYALPSQGFYEQVWNSVPQFWKFLGPQAPNFNHYTHLYH